MAAATKISRKDIKKPDEFITFSGRMIEWIIANNQLLLTGLGAFLLIVIIVVSLQAYVKNKEEKADTLLSEVQALYDNAADLNNPQMPSSLITTAEKEEEALEILEKISDQYSSTSASRIAGLFQGQIYFDKGDYDASQKAYEWLLEKHGSGEDEISALAWEGLAYCHEAKAAYDKALEAYEKMKQSSLLPIQGWALLGMARCREKLGEPDKALADYRQFVVDYSAHPKIGETRANIARMEQMGLGAASERSENSDEPEE